jgi:hypothetical protein
MKNEGIYGYLNLERVQISIKTIPYFYYASRTAPNCSRGSVKNTVAQSQIVSLKIICLLVWIFPHKSY